MAELYRYAAFISYSSKDAKFAQRLHRALERYGIPSSLGQFDLIGGGKRNRIYPVFRDREELSAGHLGDQIEANLKASATLIVVCSPNSAASPWVQKEIEFFAALGRHAKVFAIIPDTAPLVDDTGADCTHSCFPAAFRGDALSGDKLEPLAADARKGKDGFRSAWMKIVAGMIGVNAGSLEDRDRKRRRGRRRAVSVSLLSALFLASGAYVLQARIRHDQANRVLFSAVEKELTAIKSTTLEDIGSSSRAVRFSVLASKSDFLFPKSPLAEGVLIRALNVQEVGYSSNRQFDLNEREVRQAFPEFQGNAEYVDIYGQSYDPESSAMYALVVISDEYAQDDRAQIFALGRFRIEDEATDLAVLNARCSDVYAGQNIVLSCEDEESPFFLFADKQTLREVGRVRDRESLATDRASIRFFDGLGLGTEAVTATEARMVSLAQTPHVNSADRDKLYSSVTRGSAYSLAHNLSAWIGEYGEITIWDPTDGRTILQSERTGLFMACCAQFSNSGRELLFGRWDRVVEVPFDPETFTFQASENLSWEERQRAFDWKLANTGLIDGVETFEVSPDGKWLIAATGQGTAALMRRAYNGSWTLTKSYDGREFGPISRISPDWSTGTFVFYNDYLKAFWKSRDVDGSRPTRISWEELGPFVWKNASLVAYIARHAAGERRDQALARLDKVAMAHQAMWGAKPSQVAVSQSHAVFASVGDGHLGIWSDKVELIHENEISEHVRAGSVSFSPDGRRLVMIVGPGEIHSLDIGGERASCQSEIKAHFVTFDSSGAFIVAVNNHGRSGGPRLIDPTTCANVSDEADQEMISRAELSEAKEGGATYFDEGQRMVVYDGTDLVIFDRISGMVLSAHTINESFATSDSFLPSIVIDEDKLFFVDQFGNAFSLDLRPYLTNDSRVARGLPTYLDQACDPATGLLRGHQRFITASDVELAPVLEGREGKDVCIKDTSLNRFRSPW